MVPLEHAQDLIPHLVRVFYYKNMTHKLKSVEKNYVPSELEEEVLRYWKENKTFEKSVEQRDVNNSFSFYDGPPFITGLPHYGSLLSSIGKDIVPRYQTMKGKRVRRVWGWDCHGLPAENKVEQQLGINSKKEIETLGIDKFVDACKAYVDNVSGEWEWYVDHVGRWVDFKNAYRTMDMPYMESVWWVFKQLYEKNLIYKGKRVSLFCPRCSTPISNFEVAMDNSYKDVEDPSVMIKFKLTQQDAFIVAWTTTPWTLPSNFALAVSADETYVKVEVDGENLIVAKKLSQKIFGDEVKVIEEMTGKDLVGLKYEPLYKYFESNDKDYTVYAADFVSMEDGTGIVHIAPGFGEDDTNLGKKEGLSMAESVTDEGKLIDKVAVAAGLFFKKADKVIIEDLKTRNIMLREGRITHSYPHCHRCGTPLLYKAQEAWYVDVQSIKPDLLSTNENINWVPGHFKKGRFKLGIDSAPDWCISRSRYWGTPLPVWEEPKSGWRFVPGSIKELEEASGQKITELHRPDIDDVTVTAPNGEKAYRVKEVLDSWIEAASMPYAERHYPFENEEEFKKSFPGDFIFEYTGQIRAWFYVLHVISNALFGTNSFKNVVVTGVILGNDGRKMSKNFGNYPDPKATITRLGGDSLRLYLAGSPIMMGEDVAINENDWGDMLRSIPMLLWNSYKFFVNYAALDSFEYDAAKQLDLTALDQWIMSRLEETKKEVGEMMDAFNTPKAVTSLKLFLNDYSTWYIRRSRDRVGPSAADATDKEVCYSVMYRVLKDYLLILAPFAPFISEHIYRELTGEESVHLADWPTTDESLIDTKIDTVMDFVRKAVETGHGERRAQNIPVKQALASISIMANKMPDISYHIDWVKKLVQDELNVLDVDFEENSEWSAQLDLKITDELKDLGLAREIIRNIQQARKEAGCRLDEWVDAALPSWPASLEEEIKRKTLIKNLTVGETLKIDRVQQVS
jgi:isoleucyl-tRNA synthetase